MAAVDKQAGVDHICRSKEDSQSQSMRTKYLILRQDGGSSSCLIYVKPIGLGGLSMERGPLPARKKARSRAALLIRTIISPHLKLGCLRKCTEHCLYPREDRVTFQ
ncbi:hypothetical protein GBA52_015463 [Prunus armeniaca]|nr:hypothetical protein GBA52_015463 [Prunus armeniaca]